MKPKVGDKVATTEGKLFFIHRIEGSKVHIGSLKSLDIAQFTTQCSIQDRTVWFVQTQ